MIEFIVLQLCRASVFLAVGFPLVWVMIRYGRFRSALGQRLAWGTLLVCSLLCMSVPVSIPVTETPGVIGTRTPRPQVVAPTSNEKQTQQIETVPSRFAEYDVPVVRFANENHEEAVPPAVETVSPKELLWNRIFATLFTIWLFGVLCVWGRRGVALLSLWRTWTAGPPGSAGFQPASRSEKNAVQTVSDHSLAGKMPADPGFEQWSDLLKRFGVTENKIPLRMTESAGPALVRDFWLQLFLIVPESLWDELSPELREGVLRHELGHYRHGDAVLSPLMFFLASLQWFNPFAWFVLRCYDEATEWHADEFAYGNREYGSSELAETFLVIHRSTESLGLYLNSFSRYSTLDRVNRLLPGVGKEHFMKKLIITTLIAVFVCCGVIHFKLVAEPTELTEQQKKLALAVMPDEPKITITGKVRLPDGSPAAKYHVSYESVGYVFGEEFSSAEGKLPPSKKSCSLTTQGTGTNVEPDGTFTFKNIALPGSNVVLWIGSQGKGENFVSPPIVFEAKKDMKPLDITLQKGIRVFGEFKYENGSVAGQRSLWFKQSLVPARGADDSLFREVFWMSRFAKSDEYGNYEVFLPPGEYEISPAPSYDGKQKLTLTATEILPQERFDWKFPNPIFFEIQIDGKPLRKMIRYTLTGNTSQGCYGSSSFSNEDGTFVLDPITDERFMLLQTDDKDFGIVETITPDMIGKVHKIELKPSAKVFLTLVDAKTGNPIPDTTVSVSGQYTTMNDGFTVDNSFGLDGARSDEDGKVVLHIPPGKLNIRVNLPGSVYRQTGTALHVGNTIDREVDLAPNETLDLGTVRLQKVFETEKETRNVTINIADKDEKPISGAKVIVQLVREGEQPWNQAGRIAEFRLQSDSNGRVEFPVTKKQAAIPGMILHVAAAHPDYISMGYIYENYDSFIAKQKLPDEEKKNRTIHLEPAVKIFGTVINPDGKAASDVLVFAFSTNKDMAHQVKTTTRTNNDGKFTVSMGPSENRWLWVLPNDYAPISLTLKENETNLGTLKLQKGVILEGRAIDGDGKPVENLWMSLLLKGTPAAEAQGHDAACRAAVTDKDGRFRFRPLMPGDYYLDTDWLAEYDRYHQTLAPESAYVNLATPEFWLGKPVAKIKLPPKNTDTPFPKIDVRLTDQPVQQLEYKGLKTVDLKIRPVEKLPKRGLTWIACGTMNGAHWSSHNDISSISGTETLKIPMNLKNVYVKLSDGEANRYYPLRFRLAGTESWSNNWYATLGDVTQATTLEVEPYEPGLLKVACRKPDGTPLEQNWIGVKYKNVDFADPVVLTFDGQKVSTGIERHSPDMEFSAFEGKPVMWRYKPVLADENFVLESSGFDNESHFEPVFSETLRLKSGEKKELIVPLAKRVEREKK